MIDLHNKATISHLDPKQTYETTDLLIEQLETAWNQVSSLDLPNHMTQIKTIVFCGMGASIYGALVLKALQGSNMPYPTEMVSDYHLPQFVDEHTLVVLTSYSGTTEEVISCAQEALEKKAKMIVLTHGGPLAEFAKNHQIPAYIFDGEKNISGVPRHGLGYTILGLIGLLNKTGVITVADEEIEEAIVRMREKLPDIKARAIEDVTKIQGKVPIILAGEHLSGNAQILRNQFNESSKSFSDYYLIPDLNHHLMEGLKFPKPSPLLFLLLNTRNYSEKIQIRMDLTREVIEQNGQQVIEYATEGQTLYDDFLEVIVYGSFLSLYLGFVYDQDPAPNPFVDWFKQELSKAS